MSKQYVLIFLFVFCLSFLAEAQEETKLIQLSGLILDKDSAQGIPGVHIFLPKSKRGTTSNRLGYFSLPVKPGDELVVSAMGFQNKYFKIPFHDKDNMTIVVEIEYDTVFLDNIEILPFPSEQLFKEAIISLNIPIDQNSYHSLDDELLSYMQKSAPYNAYNNYRNYMQTSANYDNNRFQVTQNPFLNPFNWVLFFKSLKNKKKQKKSK